MRTTSFDRRLNFNRLRLGSCRRVNVFVEFVEAFQSGGDRQRSFDPSGDGFQSFVAVAGDADDDRLLTRNSAILDELLGYSHFGTAGRLSKYSLGLGQEMDTFKNFFVGYAFSPSARFLYGLKNIVTISRISNRDGTRDGVGFHGIDHVRSVLESVDNRGTAGGLSRINLVASIFNQTDADQFLESLCELR